MTIYDYIRLSEREAEQDTSLASQRDEIQRYADSKNEEVSWFEDDGFSGRSSKRPEYQRLRRSLATSGLTAVVCRSVDRLGRNLRETLDFVEEASQHGVAFVATNSGVDTSTSNGLIFIHMMGVFAQAESGAISERQAYSQGQRRSEGRSIGLPPYGFTVQHRSDGAYRVINESEAVHLRNATNLIIDGSSIRATSISISDDGARTRRGSLWTGDSLSRLLRNPSLCGLRHYQGEITTDADGVPIVDTHLAIISLADWRSLQEAMKKRPQKRVKNVRHEQLLLAGIAQCGNCSAGLTRDRYMSGDKKLPQYRCSKGKIRGCLQPVTAPANHLNEYVLKQFSGMLAFEVTEILETEDAATTLQRESLNLQIDNLLSQMQSANTNEFTEIAEKVSTLKQQQSTLIPHTESAVVPTGETFRDIIESDPRRVVKQAIEILVLSPPFKRGAKGKFQDRVTIYWRDQPLVNQSFEDAQEPLESVIAVVALFDLEARVANIFIEDAPQSSGEVI